MPTEPITALPGVANALTTDIIYAVQGGISVQETLGQVSQLMLSTNVILNNGNPNGVVAGQVSQLCLNTANNNLYVCTHTGTATTAVWTLTSPGLLAPPQGGTGVASPTAHSLPVAEGTSNFNFLGPLTNGQLLIGSTGADPTASALTAGANISISNGAGSITIAATGAASFSWTNVTVTSATMSINSGYIANNAGLVTLTLPVTAAQGSRIAVQGVGSGGWIIAQNASQQILGTGVATTVGVGGSLASTNRYNSVELVCTTANTTWNIYLAPGGILTPV
jgi:hypothetical protein